MEETPGRQGECEYVGEGMADIVGIGIIVGFVGQAALSLLLACWVFFLSKAGNLDICHEQGTVERKIEDKRLELVSEMLMTGNDIQMMLGISYMITVFVSADTIDLYHLHLVFDIVSFVGVSNAAALVCWTFCASKMPSEPKYNKRHKPQPKPGRRGRAALSNAILTTRHRTTYLFAAMFFGLTVLLCSRLQDWAPTGEPGRCYHSHWVISSGDQHPRADIIYVAITATWMLLAMASAIFFGSRRRRWVLLTAFLQFPVHLYMALALRYANQGKLEGEEQDENGWDFGQTTAVVLLSVAFGDMIKLGTEYYYFERDLRKNGMHKLDSNRDGVSRDRELDELRVEHGYTREDEDEDEEAHHGGRSSERIGRSQNEP